MPIPSPIKVTSKGVEYTSQVDRAKYLLVELQRAALKEVGKLVRKRCMQAARKLKGLRKGKRVSNTFQFWVRKKETDLQVGIRHATWYGVLQELGDSRQPKRGILRNSTFEHIDDIRRIEGMYLSSIEDENRALGLIDEDDEGENEDEP